MKEQDAAHSFDKIIELTEELNRTRLLLQNCNGDIIRADRELTRLRSELQQNAERAMQEYAAQELNKTKLKELLLKRKQEYHKDCLNDAFINGRFWECQELLELIDKL